MSFPDNESFVKPQNNCFPFMISITKILFLVIAQVHFNFIELSH